jgi:putative two-component system response regulator
MERETQARILVVDDEPYVREIIWEWLSAAGYACTVADSGQRAVEILAAERFDLVVSDITMPGMDGVALLAHVRESFPDMAVIMVTAVDDRKVAIHTLELGAYGYVIKPFTKNEILINVVNALERRRLRLLSQEYERSLEFQVRERTQEVRDREREIIFRLLSATGYRDDETGEHMKRVGLFAAEIARALGWDSRAAENMSLAAPMHDIGKIGIPDRVLRKPGKLDAREFEAIKTHPRIGAGILAGSDVPLLRLAEEIALSHHERWDGSGYPRALSGAAIPESGRIVALVDVYDALTHDRVYRPAFSEEESIAMMAEGRGRHFDPRVFDCFMDLLPEMRRIREELPDKDHPLAVAEAPRGESTGDAALELTEKRPL